MTEDHLSTETSVSAELTDTGVKASAKSRAIASVDRLVGGAVDIGSAWIEGVAERRRAKNEGERRLIEAAVEYGMAQMKADDDFARRTYEGHFKKMARQQLNKDAVVVEALEELKQNPPSDAENSSGPEAVGNDFMDSFERYAEMASTDELRERWGRVLASEIRRPGTFGSKVLRATDELDSDTAKSFERLAAHLVRPTSVSVDLVGELQFTEKLSLVAAGLIADPGMGHVTRFVGAELTGGVDVWVLDCGPYALGFKQDSAVTYSNDGPLVDNKGTPAIKAYILTDVGKALATILPLDQLDVFKRLLAAVRPSIPNDDLLCFQMDEGGTMRSVPPLIFCEKELEVPI